MNTHSHTGRNNDAAELPPQAAAGSALAGGPPKVIRGTSHPEHGDTSKPKCRTKVDYATVTCGEDLPAIRRCLERVFADAPAEPSYQDGGPMRHFRYSLRISVGGVGVGHLLWGGESQRERACIDLPGTAWGFVDDLARVEQAFAFLPQPRFRRADIAADFFRGEVTYERVKAAHDAGKFARGGRGPKCRQIISSDPEDGRTLYVGVRGGDAFFRAYEKGKQMFATPAYREARRVLESAQNLTSHDTRLNGGEPFNLANWFRTELELRSKNRPIPADWISKRDSYFAGAYPFLAELLPEAEPEIIMRPRDSGLVAVDAALATINRQWGPAIFTALAVHGGDYLEVFKKIVGTKHSPSLVAAGALLAID